MKYFKINNKTWHQFQPSRLISQYEENSVTQGVRLLWSVIPLRWENCDDAKACALVH